MRRKLGPNQTKWVEALESGKFQQCESFLRTSSGYCCLGVACEVFQDMATLVLETETKTGSHVWSYDDKDSLAPKYVIDALDLYGSGGEPDKSIIENLEDLTQLNDMGRPFKEIAEVIRLNPESYFMSER